ncbi:hypothetical protein [Labilibaculum antarcticum]|uniref:Uncharacterized protein n=1 Tax=Labilibaculum antarcticum TaxID=1717717 RepID=A0A1Y1CJX0_9BACT|nr:hypothetical protein [Labilibaculum antarcticum]BAX80635.1 hypothetical protein ALGA_2303 [Labilibaculum antarcticum]
MYFLKCNECGHLNEVKTEYLTFCSGCKKKLDNSFTNWKINNQEGSFEDYKRLICISEQDVEQLNKTEKKKNTKGIKYWIGFAVFFTIFYVIGQFGGDKIMNLFREPAFDKAMMEIASELNESCPIMVDQETRLDNAIAMQDNKFQYNYTLVNVVKDSINIEELKNNLSPTIVNFVKTNPDMKNIRDHETIVNYSYKDMTGVFLFTISVKPIEYK